MSQWLDEKYLRLLAPQLDRFAQKHAHTFNFRCPLCGDSERNTLKARGYVYPKQNSLMFKCHNCSVALPFVALLRRLNQTLYDEYTMERLRDEGKPVPAQDTPTTAQDDRYEDFSHERYVTPLHLVSRLGGALKPVYDYVRGRLVPEEQVERLAGTRKARTWLTELVGEDKAKRVDDDRLYVVIPLTLKDGEWYGAQVRALDEKIYITFRWSHDPLKVFGLDQWNAELLTYVVEGPMDSLFVPNAVAACGSDLLGTTNILDEQHILPPWTPRVYVWDNEPRNKEVTRHIKTAIRLGEPVVIWPREYPKDINDMVKVGINVNDVLPKRTFSGLRAELEFAKWKS